MLHNQYCHIVRAAHPNGMIGALEAPYYLPDADLFQATQPLHSHRRTLTTIYISNQKPSNTIACPAVSLPTINTLAGYQWRRWTLVVFRHNPKKSI